MFQVKIGIRNSVMPGARRPKIVDDEVDRRRGSPRCPTSSSPTIHRSMPDAGLEYGRVGQRRVAGPAGRRGAAATRKPEQDDEPAEQEQPVRRARSAAGTPCRRRRSGAGRCSSRARSPSASPNSSSIDRAVHREQLVVGLLARPAGGPAAASSARITQRHQRRATRKNTNAVDDVQDPDPLVVGRGQPADQAVDLSRAGRRGRSRRPSAAVTGCRSG